MIKKEWNDWGKNARRMVGFIELPPEELAELIEIGSQE